MQHFLFGSLIPFKGSVVPMDNPSDAHGHDHIHAFGIQAPTCCGKTMVKFGIGMRLVIIRIMMISLLDFHL